MAHLVKNVKMVDVTLSVVNEIPYPLVVLLVSFVYVCACVYCVCILCVGGMCVCVQVSIYDASKVPLYEKVTYMCLSNRVNTP